MRLFVRVGGDADGVVDSWLRVLCIFPCRGQVNFG